MPAVPPQGRAAASADSWGRVGLGCLPVCTDTHPLLACSSVVWFTSCSLRRCGRAGGVRPRLAVCSPFGLPAAASLTVYLQAPAGRDGSPPPPPPPHGVTPARAWSPAAAGRTARHRLTLTVRLAAAGGGGAAAAGVQGGADATPGGMWYVVDTTVRGVAGGER